MSPATWFRLLGLSCLLIAAAFVVPALTDDAKKGKKYALLVGVKSYDHSKLSDLKYTENDAEATASVLSAAKYDEVVVLTTSRGEKDARKKPTKANIDRELARLLKQVTKHDVVVIGLSGHGVQQEVKKDGKKRDESFFCPADAKVINSDDFDKLCETMLSFRKLFEQLDDSGAGSRLLLIDACRNDPGSSRNADTNAMPNPTKGTAALFACKGGERAWESAKLGEKGHGVFFHHVIEALKGKAKNKRGAVTWDSLTRHVRDEVGDDVERLIGDGAKQTPHLVANVEGDPVLVPAGKVPPPKDAITNSIGMKFVLVKKGKFTMGSPKDEPERRDDERQHEVEITRDFYLGVYEVTQGQFREVMGFNPSYFSLDGKAAETGKYFDSSKPGGGKEKVKAFTQKQLDEFPVENVSWDDAQEFIKKLNARAAEKEKGRVYRLPTEAEWEYACRGGPSSSSKPFHFKQSTDSLSSTQANFQGEYPYGGADKGKTLARTAKVGSYEANRLGLYDMHGNVSEWCQDWYDSDYYANSPARDPLCLKGSRRVDRGGSWYGIGLFCRSAYRYGLTPGYRSEFLGFRLALVPTR